MKALKLSAVVVYEIKNYVLVIAHHKKVFFPKTRISVFFFMMKIGPELTFMPIFLYSVCGTLPKHGLMRGV